MTLRLYSTLADAKREFTTLTPGEVGIYVCGVTPYYVTHKLRFEGDQVTYDAEANVGFRNTKQPQLVGRAAP